ncbi:MAG: hypothetical protein ACD_46C00262G0007 [uncultured bacterium]|nr:MAG: hypothetical protein ACD_46C00262G0007 [uncultured bacterium]
MKITVVTDIPNHWLLPYSAELVANLVANHHQAILVQQHHDIQQGDICFFLGCGQIAKHETLVKNLNNLVIHESAVPKGRGWSPLSWQILEGKNIIPMTLLEANNGPVDSGDIYLQTNMAFHGHELIDELRVEQGKKTIELAMRFVAEYPQLIKRRQEGTPTFYKQRKPQDSELDINKPLTELFEHFRIVDNEKYPAFFYFRGKKYILKIFKEDEVES